MGPVTERVAFSQEKEILYGATSVVLYYDNMGNERNCFVVTAYRRFKVALRRPAYVKVHDYYNPSKLRQPGGQGILSESSMGFNFLFRVI